MPIKISAPVPMSIHRPPHFNLSPETAKIRAELDKLEVGFGITITGLAYGKVSGIVVGYKSKKVNLGRNYSVHKEADSKVSVIRKA